jgi:hypothetical protein
VKLCGPLRARRNHWLFRLLKRIWRGASKVDASFLAESCRSRPSLRCPLTSEELTSCASDLTSAFGPLPTSARLLLPAEPTSGREITTTSYDPKRTFDGAQSHCRHTRQFAALAAACSDFMAWSIEKLPGFWLGGNSLKVAKNYPTYC